MLSRYQEVKDQMNKYVHIVTEDPELISPAPAFCLVRDAFVGEIYKLFVNNSNKELEEFLYMHECGHIIFNHVDNAEKKALGVSSRIRARFNEYKDWFDNEDSFFDYFKNYLFNVVEDFEVNSKLFTKVEFDASCMLGEHVFKQPGWRGMWPEDYNFPIGKTWREYLTYILDDLEPFLKKMKENQEGQNDKEDKKSQKGKGKSDPKPQNGGQQKPGKTGNGNGAETAGKGKSGGTAKKNDLKERKHNGGFSKEQLEKMKKDVDSRKTSELEKKANEIEKKAQDGLASQDAGDEHEAKDAQATKTLTFDELKEILLKEVFNKKNVQTRRDQMYNVNRRKLGLNNNIIIPRDTMRTEYRADDFYVILDVSGSVSKEIIDNTILMFGDLSSNFGKNSRLILWDTSLCADRKFRDYKDGVVTYGDGTYIASGIEYVAKNYLKGKRNKLFVISDFYDTLMDWKRVIKENKITDIYGVCWSPEAVENNKFIEKSFKKIYNLGI